MHVHSQSNKDVFDIFSLDMAGPSAPAPSVPSSTFVPSSNVAPAHGGAPASIPHAATSTIDSAFSAFDFDALSAPAPVVPASATAPGPTLTVADVDGLSIKDLRAHLSRLHVNAAGAVEKQDFQKLLRDALMKAAGAPSSAAPAASAASAPPLPRTAPSTTSTPPTRAAAVNLDVDAWSATGFQSFAPPPPAPAAASSPASAPLPRVIAPAVPDVTLLPIGSDGRDNPAVVADLARMVPLIPQSGLGATVGFVAVAPVVREIDGASYSGMCPVVAGDRCGDPYPPTAALGPRRCYELLLRPDIATQEVLNAFAAAASSLGTRVSLVPLSPKNHRPGTHVLTHSRACLHWLSLAYTLGSSLSSLHPATGAFLFPLSPFRSDLPSPVPLSHCPRQAWTACAAPRRACCCSSASVSCSPR